jgi:hypothetical protein
MNVGAQRLLAYGWGMGLVALSAWPAFRTPALDSYPLSTYPMFSERRGQPWLQRMVAVDRTGGATPLPPRWIANAETLQAAAAIRRAVQGGKGAMQALCAEVVSRIGSDPEFQHVRELRIQAVQYDPIEYFRAQRAPIALRTLHSCRVRR